MENTRINNRLLPTPLSGRIDFSPTGSETLTDPDDVDAILGPAMRPDGRWIYATRSPDGQGHALGFCSSPNELLRLAESDERAGILANLQRFHDDGHDDAEAARCCFRRYLIDVLLRFETYSGSGSCKVCEAPTHVLATCGYLFVSPIWLCEEHAVQSTVEKVLEPLP